MHDDNTSAQTILIALFLMISIGQSIYQFEAEHDPTRLEISYGSRSPVAVGQAVFPRDREAASSRVLKDGYIVGGQLPRHSGVDALAIRPYGRERGLRDQVSSAPLRCQSSLACAESLSSNGGRQQSMRQNRVQRLFVGG